MLSQAIKTYGVVITLDYLHQPIHESKAIWNKIVQYMLQEDFNIENRMFFITTLQERNAICVKAKHALNALDDYLKRYNKHSFQYITDFYSIDLSNDVDLYWPKNDMGTSLKGKNKETGVISSNEAEID